MGFYDAEPGNRAVARLEVAMECLGASSAGDAARLIVKPGAYALKVR